MKESLPPRAAGSYTEAEVWGAIGFVVPCVEVCGTRYSFVDEAATAFEKLCDASCAAGVVQGERTLTLSLTLRLILTLIGGFLYHLPASPQRLSKGSPPPS